jgi:hypothetical protein
MSLSPVSTIINTMTINRTLLFCTSFAATNELWEYRYKKWLDFVYKSALVRHQILLIDDGSPVLPQWSNLRIYNEPHLPTIVDEQSVLFHFNKQLGRQGILQYPGWYRSFTFASIWAKTFSFNKVIHIESDSFILSERLVDYINKLNHGWTSFYSARYNFPETCIQVICEDQIKKFLKFSRRDYGMNFANRPIELLIPFTNVEKNFVGDRYGEIEDLRGLPRGVDYATNIPSHWVEI